MRHALAAYAFLLPLPLFAQDAAVVGTMSGTLDGVEVSYVISDGEDMETSWRATEDGIEVSLAARPSDASEGLPNELTFDFVIGDPSRNPEFLGGTMALTRNDETLTATDEAISLDIDSLNAGDNSLLLRGNLRATLSASEENVSLFAEEGTTLATDIQVTIVQAETR